MIIGFIMLAQKGVGDGCCGAACDLLPVVVVGMAHCPLMAR